MVSFLVKLPVDQNCIIWGILSNHFWFGLWCLRPFQQYFSYIAAVSFIGEGNRGYREKTTDLSPVIDILNLR